MKPCVVVKLGENVQKFTQKWAEKNTSREMPKERAEGESVTGRAAAVGREAALRSPWVLSGGHPRTSQGAFWNQSVRDTLGRRGKDNQTAERRGSGRAAGGRCQVEKRTPVKKAKA